MSALPEGPAPQELQSHESSVWPAVTALGMFGMAAGLITAFARTGVGLVIAALGILVTVSGSVNWWRGLTRPEPHAVIGPATAGQDMRLGFALFIASEVAFFAAFFIGYYFLRGVSSAWPPAGSPPVGSLLVPSVNTAILVTSGVTLTAGHAALQRNDRRTFELGLLVTILLGLIFLGGQAYEWSHAELSIRSGTLGSAFYLLTGFHGMHVIIGVLFLAVNLFRSRHGAFSARHHVPVTTAGWYWHFVDVVWLLLFVSLYLV